MWRVFQLISEILSGPMFIMLAPLPEPRRRYVVNQVVECHPDLGLILPVAQGKLRFRDEREFF